jgi:drug/metabolite transporter (DMT)-like permease
MQSINVYVLVAISIFSAVIGGIARTYYSGKVAKNIADYYFSNAIGSIVPALVLVLWGGIGHVSIFTIVIGMVFGIVTVFQQIAYLKALNTGSMSYTAVIMSLSTIIPTLSGMLFWNEVITLTQYIGIVLTIACFILSIDNNDSGKKVSAKWLMYTMITFVCTGFIGVMQKYHQSSSYASELNGFLIIAFTFSFAYSIVAYFIVKKRDNISGGITKPKVSMLIFIICGIAAAGNNKLNLYLSGVMDSAVFFPLINGLGLVGMTLAAVLLFKEKLSTKRWIGLLIGTVAVVFLCNPFS